MVQGCYKCGGKLHETGGTASNVEGMSQEQQMLMMIASTLKDNISKLGQEDGVQSTLQFLAERGLIDGSSEEGMQQGISLLQAAVEHVSQAHGGRSISEEGLPEYTSGGYDDMEQGGKIPDNVLRSRLEAHMSPSEADAYLNSYKKGGYTVTRSSDRKGKTHKVVRNSDGKTEYYGYPGMGEKSKSKYGKEAFYARHAENIKKNPFFAAYARATWAEGGETDMYKQGGRKMVKRADGSYSPWGLWDSIRANRGSGKKPTQEMLKQERKIKKAQVGEQTGESSFVSSDQGVPVVGAPASPMMGAISPSMNNYNFNIQQPETVTANLGAGEAFKPENFKDYGESIELTDEKKEDPNNITPAYTTVHSGISAVQLKDEKDARKQQRWLNNLAFGSSKAYTGPGQLLRGVFGLSTIPRTISNTIKGTRTHLAQGYDASGNKLGDPQYIDHSDWKDMQKEQRKIARNQRREDRMDTGIGRMLQKEEGGEWNPFEDNRRKVTMNIHKPLFVGGGPLLTLQQWIQEDKSRLRPGYETEYEKYKKAWEDSQGQPLADKSIVSNDNSDVFNDDSNIYDPSDNSNINNSSQSNTPDVSNMNQPYTQYGTDPVNTSVALQTLGSLTNFRQGLERGFTTGYDQRQNLSRNIQAFGTMGQQAMNPADPFSGGPLAGSFANQRPGMTGTQTGVAVSGYLAGEAGDKGMSTFAKYGGSYEVGGEYDLTDEELMMLKSMGYEYEALRK